MLMQVEDLVWSRKISVVRRKVAEILSVRCRKVEHELFRVVDLAIFGGPPILIKQF